MRLLRVIKEQDIDPKAKDRNDIKYTLRETARAVVFNKKKEVALMFASKANLHILPGGGMQPNETLSETAKREVKEETGCDVKITDEVGKVIEFRDRISRIQESSCFLAKVNGKCGKPKLTKKEKKSGFQLKWASIDDAIKLIKTDKGNHVLAGFIKIREGTFLKKAKELMKL